MSSLNEYKDQLVEGVKGTVEGVQESLTNLIGSENLESAKGTVESVRQTVSHLFSAETVEGVKETLAEEAAIVTGYKDRLVGEVKETVGHLMGDADMEKEGHKQKLRGEAELAQHRAMGEPAREEWQMNARYQMGRQALIAELGRMGGFEGQKSRLRHVETHERTLGETLQLRQSDFHLKTFNMKPLWEEIRGFQSKRASSLRHVQTQEKGLLLSLPIEKDSFHLKAAPHARLFADLNKEGALATLHKVPAASIRDRSAPRLDLLRTTSQAISQSSIGALLKDIRESDSSELKHVETEDKSKPSLSFETPLKLNKVEKNRLLSEIEEGAELKHVETEDKSKPAIDKDTQIKTWDRQGFLDEVRQGTELKHI